MPPKVRRKQQGLYFHSTPPKVVLANGRPSMERRNRKQQSQNNDAIIVKPSNIRIWIHDKDIAKLTRVLWSGQGFRLLNETSTSPKVKKFLENVPLVLNSIKEIHVAVIENNTEQLQFLLELPPPAIITTKDQNGLTVVHKAAGLGYPEILDFVIKMWPQGAKEMDKTGKTPLHWAALAKDNNTAIQEMLMQNFGVEEDVIDYRMKTPAYYKTKPQELEKAFLSVLPPAPRIMRNQVVDWGLLEDDIGDLHGIRPTGKIFVEKKKKSIERLDSDIDPDLEERSKKVKKNLSENNERTAPTVSKILPNNNNNSNPENSTSPTPPILNNKDKILENGDLINGNLNSNGDDNQYHNNNDDDGDEMISREPSPSPLPPETPVQNQLYENTPMTIEQIDTPDIHEIKTPSPQMVQSDASLNQNSEINTTNEEENNLSTTISPTPNTPQSPPPPSNTNLNEDSDDENMKEDNESNEQLEFDKLESENAVIENSDNNSDNPVNSNSSNLHNNKSTNKESEEMIDNNEEVINEEEQNYNKSIEDDANVNDKNEIENEESNEINNNEETEIENNENNQKEDSLIETNNEENNNKEVELVEQNNEENNEKESELIEMNNEKSNENSELIENSNEKNDKENEEKISDTNEEINENNDKCEINNEEDQEKELNENNEIQQMNDNNNNNDTEDNKETVDNIELNEHDENNNIRNKRNLNENEDINGAAESDDEDSLHGSMDQLDYNGSVDGTQNESFRSPSSPSTSHDIEGFVHGEPDDNQVQSQSTDVVEDDEGKIAQIIQAGDMEQLASIVLNGEGNKLLGAQSSQPEIQAFLDNVPSYMNKINRVHRAARDGNLRELQTALDRRKFAIARDEISPKGATPLHVSTIFGHSGIVRYLAGRFPETTTSADEDGRTPLHYAATIDDNQHFYNLLVHFGSNSKLTDKLGNTPENYKDHKNTGHILSHKQLLKNFGADETLETEMFSDQVPDDVHSARKYLDDEDVITTLERCYKLINDSNLPNNTNTNTNTNNSSNKNNNSNNNNNNNNSGSSSSLRLNITNYLARFLKRSVFDKIKYRQTKLDHNLFDIIWPAMKKATKEKRIDEDLNNGIVAPDFDVFVVFQEFFIPLIKDMHCLNVSQEFKPHPRLFYFPLIDGEKNEFINYDIDETTRYISEAYVECTRNLDEFELPLNLNIGQIEHAERSLIEKILTTEFAKAIGEPEAGIYYTMNEVLESPSEIRNVLENSKLMISLLDLRDPQQEAECHAINGMFWPYGRGVFISHQGDLAAWINVQDHLKIIVGTPNSQPTNVGYAYSKVGRAITYLEEKIHFRESYFLGYLSSRPSFLGTSLKISTVLELPNLMKEIDNLRHLCIVRGLFMMPISDNKCRVLNMQSLGCTEWRLFQDYCTAVSNILQLEKDMSLTNSKQIAAMLVKIFRRKKNTGNNNNNND